MLQARLSAMQQQWLEAIADKCKMEDMLISAMSAAAVAASTAAGGGAGGAAAAPQYTQNTAAFAPFPDAQQVGGLSGR